MKTISVKYPQHQSIGLNNKYAHQQSARVTKMLVFMLASAVGLSILINVQQPVVNILHSNFSNFNSNNGSSNKSNSSSRTEIPKESRLIAVSPVMPDSTGRNLKKYTDIKLDKTSIEAFKKINENAKAAIASAAVKRAAAIKWNKVFLKENENRNSEVMNELSQVTEMHEYHLKKSSSGIEDRGLDQLDSSIQKYITAPESYTKIIVLGFTDNRGTKLKNVKLGLKRAEGLKALLVKKGIPAEKISIASFGSELPIGSNETEEGRYRNRRVELNVMGAASAVASATGS